MKRLLALLLAAVLSVGAAACEAPGAPEGPAGGNNPETVGDEDRTDTQLGTGGDLDEGDEEPDDEDDQGEGQEDDDDGSAG